MPLGSTTFWAVVLPVEKTNLGLNPSFERGTSGVAAIQSATLGSAPNEQAFGAWSCSVAPNSNGTSGAAFGTWSAGAGTDYTVSAYVNGQAGVNYALFVGDSAGVNVQNGSTAFIGGGTWGRVSVSYNEASGAVRRPVIRKTSGNNTGTFYVDGVQVEVGSLSTYLDGDQEGCTWLGAPHQSASLRSGQSRAGGSVVALADLGYRVQEEIGIGMPPLETTSQSYALIPGAEFQSQRAGIRPFVLTSTVIGTTWEGFHNQRRVIIDALKIDAVSEQQPIRFWYTGGMGTVQIDAVLDSGLEGGDRDGFAENYGAHFQAFDPYWAQTTDQGTALAPRVSLGSTNYIVYRDPLGRWGTMGANGSTVQGAAPTAVYAIEPLNGGTLLIGGQWGTVGGTVYPALGLWNQTNNTFGTLVGGTVNQTGGPGNTTVYDFANTPYGTIFIGGNVGTFAGTVRPHVAFWNGAAFGTLIGGSVNAQVRTLEWNGTLFFGGNFNVVAGTTAPFVAMHVNNAFGTLTGGTIDNQVLALETGLDDRLLIGGYFLTAAGTTANGFAFWNGAFGTAVAGVGSGAQAGTVVTSIITAQNGVNYLGGGFTNASNGSANGVAAYNGLRLSPVGSGVQNGANAAIAYALYEDVSSGIIYAGGRFGTAGGIPTSDGLARWTGAAWLPPDFAVDPGQGTFYRLVQDGFGTLYAGGGFAGTGYAAAVAQVVNIGAAQSYPVFKSRNTGAGTARLYQYINTLTGDAIYFNLVLQAGEQVTLTTEPGSRSLISDFRGNLFGKILGGSNLSTFRLQPGTNYISVFSDSDSLQTSMYWRPRHWSADGTIT